jgi:hypothetical protein
MGSFYANIHLRTTERERVLRGWQGYWAGREERAWAWVSPVYGGWVSVFDWRGDAQDTDVLLELAAHLSRELDGVALAFQVQDSELAEYWLFNAGREVDHYTSNADYFAAAAEWPSTTPADGVYSGYGPDSRPGYATEDDLTDGGNTGLLRSLANADVSEVELEAILRTPAYIADDILTALASALGIHDSWAALGYHYLATDGDTILGLDAFSHLPSGEPPNLQRGVEERD